MALAIWLAVIAWPENDNSRKINSRMGRRTRRRPASSGSGAASPAEIADPSISMAARNPSWRALISLASSAFCSLSASAVNRSASSTSRYARAFSFRVDIEAHPCPLRYLINRSRPKRSSISRVPSVTPCRGPMQLPYWLYTGYLPSTMLLWAVQSISIPHIGHFFDRMVNLCGTSVSANRFR